jgi:hypothetical protein
MYNLFRICVVFEDSVTWSGACLALFTFAYLTTLLLLVVDRRPPPLALDTAEFRAGRWAEARTIGKVLAALLLVWVLAIWALAWFG